MVGPRWGCLVLAGFARLFEGMAADLGINPIFPRQVWLFFGRGFVVGNVAQEELTGGGRDSGGEGRAGRRTFGTVANWGRQGFRGVRGLRHFRGGRARRFSW